MSMNEAELRAVIEAILFVAGEPVKLTDLSDALDEEIGAVTLQVEEIRKNLEEGGHGFTLEDAGGGIRLATRPEQDSALRKFFSKRGEGRLSIAALETLAIIAYRQPITAPEISELRGVNSTGVLRTLLERRMIRIAGRKNVVGSPFLYRTTREFLVHFGLNEVQDLPKLDEFAEVLGENMTEELFQTAAAEPVADLEGLPTASADAAIPFEASEERAESGTGVKEETGDEGNTFNGALVGEERGDTGQSHAETSASPGSNAEETLESSSGHEPEQR